MPRKKKPQAPPRTDRGDESPRTENGAGEEGSRGKRAKKSSTPKKKPAKKKPAKTKATTKARKKAPKKKAPEKKAPEKKAAKKKAAKKKAPKEKAAKEKAAEEKAAEEKAPEEKTPKKKTPKKKRARKKARKKVEEPEPAPPQVEASPDRAETEPSPAPPEADQEPLIEILDDDPDTAESAEELIADLEADRHEAEAAQESATSLDAEAIDAGPVADLDADLDEDESTADAVDRLIAETLAIAKEVEVEPEAEETGIDLHEPPTATVDVAPPVEPPVTRQGPHPEQEPVGAASEAVEAGSAPEATDLEAATPEGAERGDVSTPEFRDRLLAEALAHAEHQDARYRVPFSDAARILRWKGIIASVVFLVAMVVGFAPPSWVRPAPPAELTSAARVRAIRLGLLLQAQQVEAYRMRSQRLPTTLDELPVRLPGVRYTRSGSRAFQLVAYEPDGDPIVYDSASPAPAFRSLAGAWTPQDETR